MSDAELAQMWRYFVISLGAVCVAFVARENAEKHFCQPRKRLGCINSLVLTLAGLVIGTTAIPMGVGVWFYPDHEGGGINWNINWGRAVSVGVAWWTVGWLGWIEGCIQWSTTRRNRGVS